MRWQVLPEGLRGFGATREIMSYQFYLVGGALAAPAAAVDGLHIFTFNQVRQTETWRRALLDRLSAHIPP